MALREEGPAALTETSTAAQRAKFEKWDKANRMVVLIMERTMSETVRGGIPDKENAKEFLKAVGEKYKKSGKAETRNLMNSLTTLKYDENGSVCEYIMKLIDIATKLKGLEMPIPDSFVVISCSIHCWLSMVN